MICEEEKLKQTQLLSLTTENDTNDYSIIKMISR